MAKPSQEQENFVEPRYSRLKMFLYEPIARTSRITLKGWQLPHLVLWGALIWLYTTITEESIIYVPLFLWIWGPMLLVAFVVLDSERFHRLLRWLGWFYILRGPNQMPIMDLFMRPTARLAVRVANAVAIGYVGLLLDLLVFWLLELVPPGLVLLLKFVIYSIVGYASMYGVDQWWVFRRTKMSFVLMGLLLIGTISLYYWFFDFSKDTVICPPILCPEG